MLSRLIQNLNAVDKQTELVSTVDGIKVLILPYGARVLGLFAPHDERNFFWTHPALEDVDSAKAFYSSTVWHNSGGDRTWLAPEIDFFLPNYPDIDFGGYWQPRQLDPGSYELVRKGGDCLLVSRFSLMTSRSKVRADMEITKSVGIAHNPLRYEPLWKELEDVQYAGYSQHTTLQLLQITGNGSLQVGLWDLLQLPHGGELLVATYCHASTKTYFGKVEPDDLVVNDHLVRYRMRAMGEHKLGFRAVDTTGRVGYLYSTGDQVVLVVRNFAVNPSGEYVDVPWTEEESRGYSTQTCNVNSALGKFSEIEYHVPAIGTGTGSVRSEDVSQVWAFRGTSDKIHRIAKILLSSTD